MISIRTYLYGAALAALLACFLYYGHTRYQAGKAAGDAQLQAYRAEQWERSVKAQEAARAAVEQRITAALKAAEQSRKVAEQDTRTWKRRYQDALQQPSCAAWSAAVVRCPTPGPST